MRKVGLLICVLYGVCLVSAASASSDTDQNTSYFRISFGNDTFVNTDRNFTSGGKLTFMSKNLENYRAFPLLNGLFTRTGTESLHTYSLSIGQNIYTPRNIETTEFQENDRLYAGYLFFELGLHSMDDRVQDTFILDVGIVGRHSFAREFQKFFHDVFNHEDPLGWEHQLKDEFAIQTVFERKLKLYRTAVTNRWGLELIPHMGGGLGNVYIYANGGAQVRFGWNVPDDYGIDLHRPGGDSNVGFIQWEERFSAYLLGGVDFQAVYRDIFLDGNTIVDSPRLEKYPFTASLFTGLGFRVKRFCVTAVLVFWGKKYVMELEPHKFGVLNISYFF